MHTEQSTDIRLRPAHIADAPVLAALAARIWPEAFADMITRAQIDYMLTTIQSAEAMSAQMREGMLYFFVESDAQRVGYAAVRHDPAARDTQLSKLYVLASHRNGRVAAEALGRICAAARAAGSQTLSLTVNKGNTRAIRFYAKHGFAQTRDIVMDIGAGFVMDDYVMTLKLETAA